MIPRPLAPVAPPGLRISITATVLLAMVAVLLVQSHGMAVWPLSSITRVAAAAVLPLHPPDPC